jgi:ribonuclease/clavin/mitogillin
VTHGVEAVARGVRRLALRTPTLPPATTTNAVVLGDRALTVVDPASPHEDERARLLHALDGLGEVQRILLTHHHHDHVGGAVALQAALAARGRAVPIAAHAVTAALLTGEVPVDEVLGEVVEVDGRQVDVVFTPGHAPGHVALHLAAEDVIVAGDMVAAEGTILLDPDEGDLADYLGSLEALRSRCPATLVPSHGPPLRDGAATLQTYIAHRHARSHQLREALVALGGATPEGLVARVYPDVGPFVAALAGRQVITHLRWMAAHGLARREGDDDDGRWLP